MRSFPSARKLFASLAFSALALTAGSAVAADAPFTICVVHNNADHPSITAIVKGMNDEGKIYGADITYFDPAFDPQKQASMVEDCIARKPSVIVVNAVDPAAVVQVLKKANEAGIPVVMQNADTNDAGHAFSKTLHRLAVLRPGLCSGPDDRQGDRRQGQPGDDHRQARPVRRRPARRRRQGSLRRRQGGHQNPRRGAGRLEQGQGPHRHAGPSHPLPEHRHRLRPGRSRWRSARSRRSRPRAPRASRSSASTATRTPATRSRPATCTAPPCSSATWSASTPCGSAYDIYKGRQVPTKMLAPTAPVTPDNVTALYDQCW